MTPKMPWLPSEVPPGAQVEACPFCRARAFIPWTLRRDDRSKVVLRTWICAECQRSEERPEPD
jgi:hypothetical protein